MLIKLFFILSFLIPSNENCLLMSVPKSGTHLAANLFDLLLEKRYLFIRNFAEIKNMSTWHPGCYYCIHFNNPIDHPTIWNLEPKMDHLFLIYRDPRDVLISTINYYSHVLNKHLGIHSSFDERLTYTILYEGMDGFFGPLVHYLRAFDAEKILKPFVFKYEDLVGPKGGGDADAQKMTIIEIGKKLNIPISEKRALELGKAIYGTSATFRVGKIGTWKKYFKPIHKEQFKHSKHQQVLEFLGYEKDDLW